MNATQLLEHFDRLAEAPGAVARLRRFILDLAVRGKLVEQDVGDEPASALLKKIENEIARLVKIGQMRKPKELPHIETEDEPFGAPKGWRWVRMRQVTSDRGQTTPVGDFTYIDVGSINKEAGVLGEHKVLAASDAPSRARKVVGKGDVLYSCVRPTLLNIAVVEHEIKPTPIASTAFAVLNSFGLVLPRYLWIALRSPYLEAIVEAGMRGQTYPAINDAEFALLPLALPPLAEQHRIVAKVDELMTLCDQLEAAQQERERRRDRLASASLQRLNQPAVDATPDTQREHARFHLNHLPCLTTRPAQIKAMRQAILNFAVHGWLVPQMPIEGSAANQLQAALTSRRASWEAQQTAKAKITGRELSKIWKKKYPEPIHEEGLFELPSGWVWASTLEICVCVENGNTPSSHEMTDGGGEIPFIKVYNLTKTGELDFTVKPTFITRQVHEQKLQRSRIRPGDVLMNIVGPPLGKVSLVTNQFSEWNTNQAVVLFRPTEVLLPKYLTICLLSDAVLTWITRLAQATVGQSNISVGKSRVLPIPLPPLPEQHRIVTKVDELMALCDQLEAQLTTTQTDSRRLLEAVLEAALAPV